MRLLLFVTMLLILQSAEAQSLYRWVDKEGRVHYGDVPPADEQDIETLKVGPSPASSVDETKYPYEARVAAKNFPVTLYVAESCGDSCKMARDFLAKRQVPYSEVTLKTPEEFQAFQQKSGSDRVPTVLIGKTWLKGFLASQWNDELDAAGYPKSR